MMKDRLKCNPVPIQLPIGAEDTYKGLIDLVNMKAIVYYDDLGKDYRDEEIPADLMDKGLIGPGSAEKRASLVKKLKLPQHISTKGLLEALNLLLTPEEWEEL